MKNKSQSKHNFFTSDYFNQTQQEIADRSYQAFMNTKANAPHNHSLAGATASSITKEVIEQTIHHSHPRLAPVFGAAAGITELHFGFVERQQQSLQEGREPNEANLCATLGASTETVVKIIGFGALQVATVTTRGLFRLVAAAPLIEAGAHNAGNLVQNACHATHELSRQLSQPLEQSTAPRLRKY